MAAHQDSGGPRLQLGAAQATFDGHPLYTFVGDTAPGQARGNGVNAAGTTVLATASVPDA